MNTKTQKNLVNPLELFIIHIYIYTLKTVIFLLYLGTVHVNSSKSKISFVPNQSQVHKLQQAIEKKNVYWL